MIAMATQTNWITLLPSPEQLFESLKQDPKKALTNHERGVLLLALKENPMLQRTVPGNDEYPNFCVIKMQTHDGGQISRELFINQLGTWGIGSVVLRMRDTWLKNEYGTRNPPIVPISIDVVFDEAKHREMHNHYDTGRFYNGNFFGNMLGGETRVVVQTEKGETTEIC